MMGEEKCNACGHRSLITSTICIGCLERSDREMRELKEELISTRLQLRLNRRMVKHIFAEYQRLQKIKYINKGRRIEELEQMVDELKDTVWELRNS